MTRRRPSRRASAVMAVAVLAGLGVAALAPSVNAAPNDPLFRRQWGPKNLDVEKAWTRTTGDGVVVAIVDSGVDVDHPDLKAKLLPGYDFVDDDSNPDDPDGHGTHVAGIAAAITGNGVGIAGVAPDARILPVRAISTGGEPTPSTAILDGIRWAADNGAEVINVSLTAIGTYLGLIPFDDVADGCEYAYRQGSLCVVSAGNDASSGNDQPSGYDYAFNGIVATAHDVHDRHASFAARADTKWAVSAPGVDIVSTWPGGDYQPRQGTSMAAPHVAGLAALLVAQGMTNQQVAERIVATAVPASNAQLSGAGRVNAARAVGLEATTRTTTEAPDLSGNTVSGGDFTPSDPGQSGGATPGVGDTTDTTDALAGTGRGDDDFGADLAESGIEGDVSIATRRLDLGDYRKQTYGFLAGTLIVGVGGWAIWQQRAFARRRDEATEGVRAL